jgi:hypothetical protein
MRHGPPLEWAGIPWNTDHRVTIYDEKGEEIAVGKGMILRHDSGTFWIDGRKTTAILTAAFLTIGNSAPVVLKRLFPRGDGGMNWVFEV